MKKKNMLIVVLLVSQTNLFAQIAKTNPEGFEQKLSYAVGYDVTRSLRKMDIELSKEWMIQGIIDALTDSGGSPIMTYEDMEVVFQELQKKNLEKEESKASDLAIPNLEAGKKYAEEQMKLNSEMKKSESGLVYMEIKKGKGKKPNLNSTIVVKYKGSLIDGTVFDRTVNESATFEVSGVIPGWTEGVQLMQEGAIYKFIIPSNLAYNNNPPPGTPIQPGSTLVFEVELVKIK